MLSYVEDFLQFTFLEYIPPDVLLVSPIAFPHNSHIDLGAFTRQSLAGLKLGREETFACMAASHMHTVRSLEAKICLLGDKPESRIVARTIVPQLKSTLAAPHNGAAVAIGYHLKHDLYSELKRMFYRLLSYLAKHPQLLRSEKLFSAHR